MNDSNTYNIWCAIYYRREHSQKAVPHGSFEFAGEENKGGGREDWIKEMQEEHRTKHHVKVIFTRGGTHRRKEENNRKAGKHART